mgnify:FL=1
MTSCKSVNSAKFSTYAYYYVLGEVTKYIREDRTVKISRDIIKLNKSIEKARELLRQKLSREPSDMEVSIFLEIDEEKIALAKEATNYIKSLDEEIGDTDSSDYYNSVKVYDKNMDSNIMDLNTQINLLNEEDKKIIYDRYFNGYTQSEISREMGISQVQVSRKETKILEKLKVRL